MKIAVISAHSKENEALARMTAQNHWDYSCRHEYNHVVLRRDLEDALHNGHRHIGRILAQHDAVLTVGSDVVFTNLGIAVEHIIQPDDSVIMSREMTGRSKINNDVVIWMNCKPAFDLLAWLIEENPRWHQKMTAGAWQSHLADNAEMLSMVTIKEPRVMNSTDFLEEEWAWKPMDWVCHCHGGTIENKMDRVRAAMERIR